MTKQLTTIAMALGLAAIGFGGAQAADPVRIGFSLPITGIFAPAAPSQQKAYELWRDQVNAKGGLDVAGTKRPVEFVSYDDQSDPGKPPRSMRSSSPRTKSICCWGRGARRTTLPLPAFSSASSFRWSEIPQLPFSCVT